MKRLVTGIMAAVLAASILSGCSGGGGEKMSVMVFTNQNLNELEATKKVEAMTDKKIEWQPVNSNEQISLAFASNDFPDVILSNVLQDIDVSKYAANGVLVPLESYIREDLTPNLCKLFEKVPTAKAISTMTDGHIYTLPRYAGMESDYVENYMFINKKWLDKLNLTVPTTIDELYNVLKAFKEQDPNGNGQADEIPLTFMNGSAFAYPEVMLSCWGVATKHGNFEGFTTVKNGEVLFAPMMDEWKEMILFYNKLYKEGLLDMEAFTHSNSQYNAKLASANSIVGMAWGKSNTFGNPDEYIVIDPVKVPGYDILWKKHPGYLGIKNQFAVTNACQDIEAAMKWIDQFYTEEATLENWYGPEGVTFTKTDGMYHFNEPEEGMTLAMWCGENTINGVNMPGVFYQEEIGTLVEDSEIWSGAAANYAMYEKYLDTETWPRPYYTPENAERIAVLRTDIFNIVEQQKAKWIVGTEDVETGWDAYLENLKAVGVEEYIKINQETYDAYQKSLNQP